MRKPAIILLTVLALGVIAYYSYFKSYLSVATGYAAKNLCSCVFVAGMNEEVIKEVDLNFSFIALASKEVDYRKKRTHSSLWGLASRSAVYRPGLGCVLINDVDESILSQESFKPSQNRKDSLVNWFEISDTVDLLTSAQSSELEKVIASAFENDTDGTINTRGVVVLSHGQLIGEDYAEGFHKDSRLLGWSMTKSITGTMAGLMIRDGYFTLETPAPVEGWRGTPKERITYQDLIQMSSGLQFEEEYGSYSDANKMLWLSDATGMSTVGQPLEADPGEKWYYSSGTTNLLMILMRRYFPDRETYLDYLYKELFSKIGAYSMIIEPDGSGHFVGSSFGWGTARDWARLGQLYLNGGSWGEEQILPEEWVSFVQRHPRDPEARDTYGGHFWLNLPHPDLPDDTYYMAGFHGQRVFIIPSKNLVVVRIGVTYNGDFKFDEFVSRIIEVLEN